MLKYARAIFMVKTGGLCHNNVENGFAVQYDFLTSYWSQLNFPLYFKIISIRGLFRYDGIKLSIRE